MKTAQQLASMLLGATGLTSLVLGLAIAYPGTAAVAQPTLTSGDCKTTASGCGAGTCTTAARDCTSVDN